MATVVFYEKPGCINNTRQKNLLLEAGHVIDARNLLTTSWKLDDLRSFFGNMPLVEWFNPSAPAIKNGAVVPADLDEEQAFDIMLQDPLLIRRPLMQVGDKRCVGFDTELVNEWIGLAKAAAMDDVNLEACPRTDQQHCETTDQL